MEKVKRRKNRIERERSQILPTIECDCCWKVYVKKMVTSTQVSEKINFKAVTQLYMQ